MIIPIFYEQKTFKGEVPCPKSQGLFMAETIQPRPSVIAFQIKNYPSAPPTWIFGIRDLFSQEHNYSVSLLRNVKKDQQQK